MSETRIPYRDPIDEDGPLFHQYQTECATLALSVEFLVIEKSRRIGISWCLAGVACIIAAPKEGAQDVFYMAYNFEMTRTFIDDCADFLRAFHSISVTPGEFLYDDGGKDIKAFRIDLPSGKSIIALSSNPRSLRSKQGVAIIDEAALHDDLDGVLAAALPLTMLGGRVIVLSTHYGTDNAFNTLVNDIRSGKIEAEVLRITLKDALEDGFFKRICRTTNKEWSPEAEAKWEASLRKRQPGSAAEEFDCIPSSGGGVYLPRATIEAAMSPLYPVIRLTCPDGFERNPLEWRTKYVKEWLEDNLQSILEGLDPTRNFYLGIDYARVNDLSVVAPGYFDDLAILVVPFILEMRNVPSREQWQILDFIISYLRLFCAAKVDGRGNGQDTAAYLQDHYGYDRVEAIMATVNTYLTMMPRLKGRIDDRTILMPQNEGIVDDLRLIKLVKGVPMIVDHAEDKADGTNNKRHGDSAIALMNLVAAADEDTGPFNFESTGTRSTSDDGDFTETDIGFGTVRRASTDDYQNLGSIY